MLLFRASLVTVGRDGSETTCESVRWLASIVPGIRAGPSKRHRAKRLSWHTSRNLEPVICTAQCQEPTPCFQIQRLEEIGLSYGQLSSSSNGVGIMNRLFLCSPEWGRPYERLGSKGRTVTLRIS